MLEPPPPAAATPSTRAAPTHAAPPAGRHPSGFRLLLSELNPLQYVPVVGTLYRAVTGDRIPERARLIGGFIMSGLLGGPLGLAWDAAEVGVEKAAGVDPEAIGDRVLAGAGIGAGPPAPDRAIAGPPAPTAQPAIASYAKAAAVTPMPLTADDLNQRELDRLNAKSA